MTDTIRILVVDDDPDILDGTARLLANAGYAVGKASSCAETLRAVQDLHPELVLLDRDLPDGDGMEICRQIKEDRVFKHVFVILISGTLTGIIHQTEGLEWGADGYISRPIGNRELAARILPYARMIRLTKSLNETAEHLREQNEALAMRDRAINATKEGICITSSLAAGAELIYVNRGFELLTGYRADEVLGRNMRFLQGSGTSPEAIDRLRTAIETEEAYTIDLLNYRKNGTSFWNRVSITPVRNDSGSVTQFVAVISDISSEKATALALRESAARLIEAQQLGSMGDWEFDVPTQQVSWSQEVFRLYERDLAEGQPSYREALAYYTPETMDYLDDCIQTAIKTGESWQLELHVRLPSGREATHYAAGRAHKDQNGEVIRLAGVVQDITERKQAEEALRNSERRLKEAQAVGRIGDWQYDVETEHIDWSEELFRLFDRDIAAGTPTFEENLTFYYPEDALRLQDCVRRAVETGESYQLDLHARLPDGRDAYHFAIGHAAKDNNGKVVKLYGIAQDVTARRRAEERVLQLNRVYAVLSSINQTIIRVRDRRTLFDEACRIAVEDGKFRAAWIGLLDEASGDVRVAAKAGAIEGYLEVIHITNRREADGLGPMGTAIRENRSVICNDLENDPIFAPWREPALRRGFRSVAVFPLRIGGRTAGGFAQYSEVPDFFDQLEVQLLEELASDISFAVEFQEQGESRKRAELAQAESEMRFSAAFHYAAVGMALVSPDGRFLKVNPALCSLLGYTEEELLSLSFQDITHPEDLESDLDGVLGLLAGERKTYQMEKRYWHKSGSLAWALLSVSLVRDHLGRPLHFISQVQDITSRRQSEEALRKSEERYRKLAENFPFGVVNTYDRELRMTYVGGTDLKKFGVTADMFLGKHFKEVAPPETWAVAEPFLKEAFTGKTVSYETPYSDNRYYNVTVAPLYAADRTIEEILVVSQNISERKWAEEEVRTAHQRLTYHIENSPLGVVEWDSNFRVNHWSRRAEELFGWSAGEVSGLLPSEWQFVHPEDAPSVWKTMGGLLQGAELNNFSANRNFTKDGRVLYCEWYNSAMLAPGGGLVSILSLVHDTTDRMLAQESLLKSQAQLRALTARVETLREEERTRISREIHDELGQMLSGIKMDLRWMERRLDEFGDNRGVNPILDKLMATSELADVTIKTVQRIASDLRPGILDTLGLATALQYEVARFEERTHIRCRIEVPTDLAPVGAESATALFRIFQEALTNIFRHAHATLVEVKLQIDPTECRLEICDNGRGITGFDMAKPTSLGLLGMQERARLLGGEVSFSARQGGGTVVSVLIPHPRDPEVSL